MNKKPELLAPAGSIESFHAAIDAGADAIYAGLSDFNARIRAKNFTAKTLSFLVPYAKSRKRRVYITLNTLVKQTELEKLVNTLYQLEQIGVDGLIVQDFGLVEICRRHFPRLKLHASTQMSIHNSTGVAAAACMGLCRAVLARELTIQEIRTIAVKSPIELEVFVHGALCYCISGMCLASSFLGGSSGNRGRCTQVCRRPFVSGENRGCFFSPMDFCALEFIEKYRDAGIASLKIEGRMKNADYVAFVVGMYRQAIDDPSSVHGLLERAAFDLGRKKTNFFLDGVKNGGIIDKSVLSGTGLFAGYVEDAAGREIRVGGISPVATGDVIRIQPVSGFDGRNVRTVGVKHEGKSSVITLIDAIPCVQGDAVYISRRMIASTGMEHKSIKTAPKRFRQIFPDMRTVLGHYGIKHRKNTEGDSLYVRIDDPGWLDILDPGADYGMIAAFSRHDIEKFCPDIPEVMRKKIVVCLPYFIPEAEINEWKYTAAHLKEKGFYRIMCRNIGQWMLFGSDVSFYGDSWLWCFNTAAQAALAKAGIRTFTYSIEDDFMNMRNAASASAVACLYCNVPLFISRVKPGVEPVTILSDALGNRFHTVEKNSMFFLVASEPLCLFQKKKRLLDAGIRAFMIDLSFCKPDRTFFEDILEHYRSGINVPDSRLFNFKAGIK
jgi:U32 family peptidase